jgi:transcriptional regulator with XRE-family HTH domain
MQRRPHRDGNVRGYELSERMRQTQQRGWSDYKIAQEAGLSSNTVSNIYRRGNTPSMVTHEALCKAFGITMAQFFAEGDMIEITPELRELFDKWSALKPEQKEAIWQIIKSYE